MLSQVYVLETPSQTVFCPSAVKRRKKSQMKIHMIGSYVWLLLSPIFFYRGKFKVNMI